MTRILVGTTLALGLLFGPSAQAQSFNCRYAKTSDEVAICNSPELRLKDAIMGAKYFENRNNNVGWRQGAIRYNQADWLRSRRSCGGDYSCLHRAYNARISELVE